MADAVEHAPPARLQGGVDLGGAGLDAAAAAAQGVVLDDAVAGMLELFAQLCAHELGVERVEGDAGVGMEGRLEVDIKLMAYIHAATMYLYLAATALVAWQLQRRNAPQAALRTAYVLIAMIFVQWAIGIIQFNLGIPRWTVPAHIAMSSVVVAFSAFLYAHGKRRVSPAPVTPKADANARG